MHTKILAATAAFLLAWVALKLWLTPPKDLMAVALMIGKGVLFGSLCLHGASWLWDKLAQRQRAD